MSLSPKPEECSAPGRASRPQLDMRAGAALRRDEVMAPGRLSLNLEAIAGSETLRIMAAVERLRARGVRVVSLAAGEPDFETPAHIRAAAVQALAEGRTRYTPNAGIPALRSAIAEKLGRENGVPYAAEEVVVTSGAKQALFNACFALFGPGDEVLIPAPYWVSYPAMVRMARAEPVIVQSEFGAGYKVTPDAIRSALTRRTRGLILNSPSNPTGAVYDEGELAALAEVCLEGDLRIISDEIYEKLSYGPGITPSIAAIAPQVRARTVTVNGFSKAYAMTGWRLGYGAAPRHVADAIGVVQSHTTSNASSISQYAGLAALTERQTTEGAVRAMREEFRRRRDLLLSGLQGLAGVESVVPEGAFYVFTDLGEVAAGAGGSEAFCARLLERQALALVPGSAFGMERHVRWSFAASQEDIEEGVRRFRAAVAGDGV